MKKNHVPEIDPKSLPAMIINGVGGRAAPMNPHDQLMQQLAARWDWARYYPEGGGYIEYFGACVRGMYAPVIQGSVHSLAYESPDILTHLLHDLEALDWQPVLFPSVPPSGPPTNYNCYEYLEVDGTPHGKHGEGPTRTIAVIRAFLEATAKEMKP